jgi:hypothetical protein
MSAPARILLRETIASLSACHSTSNASCAPCSSFTLCACLNVPNWGGIFTLAPWSTSAAISLASHRLTCRLMLPEVVPLVACPMSVSTPALPRRSGTASRSGGEGIRLVPRPLVLRSTAYCVRGCYAQA